MLAAFARFPGGIFTLTSVTVDYHDAVGLQELTLAAGRGEVVGILGAHGSGKTTLLKVLLGLAKPTSGEARVLGGHPGDPETLARIGASIGAPAFIPGLSGYDNLRAIALAKGLPHQEVRHCLALVGLAAVARRKVRAYPVADRQRLGIAAALLGDPELILLDEPMVGLDAPGTRDFRDLIAELAHGGRTVVVTAHRLRDLELIAPRIVILEAGRLSVDVAATELAGDGLARVLFHDRSRERLI